MPDPRFEVYKDASGGHRWRLRSANGRILCQGESHTRKRDAERAVKTVRETVWAIQMLEDSAKPLTKPAKKAYVKPPRALYTGIPEAGR